MGLGSRGVRVLVGEGAVSGDGAVRGGGGRGASGLAGQVAEEAVFKTLDAVEEWARERALGEEVGVDRKDIVNTACHELPLGLDAALTLDEYPTSSGTVDGVIGLLDEGRLQITQTTE